MGVVKKRRHYGPHTSSKPQKLFQCPECAYSCTTQSVFTAHYRQHTGEKPYKCILCDYATGYNCSFYAHMRKHHPEAKQYKCTVCYSAFVTPRQLKTHLKVHLDADVKITGKNKSVSGSIRRPENLGGTEKHNSAVNGKLGRSWNENNHDASVKDELQYHHKTEESSAGTPSTAFNELQCDVCRKCFNRIDSLYRHLREVHVGVRSRRDRPRAFGARRKRKPRKQLQGNAETKSGRVVILRQNDGRRPPYNRGRRPRDKSYTRRRPRDKSYKCTKCNYASDRRGDLIIHFRRHTGERPFKCSQCHYAFTQLSPMYYHMRRKHPDAKPFKCTVCGKSFVTPTRLRAHLRQHVSDKPSEHRTGNHVLDHTGEDPSQRSRLHIVGVSHNITGPHRDRSDPASALTAHPRHGTFSEDAPSFQCDVCRKILATYAQLSRHLQEVHVGNKQLNRDHTWKAPETHRSKHPQGTAVQKPKEARVILVRCDQPGSLKDTERFVGPSSGMPMQLQHTGQKPYTCTLCGYASNVKYNLERHMRRHTESKDHKCLVCGFSSSGKAQLTMHLRIHTV